MQCLVSAITVWGRLYFQHMCTCLCVCVDAITKGRTPRLSSHGSCKPIGEYPCNQSDGHYLCHMVISHIKGATAKAVLGWRPGTLGRVTTYAANCALGSRAVNTIHY